jgi:hypothetical protein
MRLRPFTRVPHMLALALAALSLASPPGARAYPIPPQSLMVLVEGADVIVVAKVLASDPVERAADDDLPDFGEHTATLLVEETLVSPRPLGGVVRIPYPAGLMCPAPPRYETDATVLAFLAADEEDGVLRTVGLSYGTKDVTDPGVRSAYVARVREALEILKVREKAARDAQTVEWLVRCAEDPHTRHEALYELTPSPDPAREVSPDEAERTDYGAMMTDAHRARLVSAVVSSASLLDYGTLALADYLLASEDPRLLARMRDEVERVASGGEEKNAWAVAGLLDRYARAVGWTRGETLARKVVEEGRGMAPAVDAKALEGYVRALRAWEATRAARQPGGA